MPDDPSYAPAASPLPALVDIAAKVQEVTGRRTEAVAHQTGHDSATHSLIIPVNGIQFTMPNEVANDPEMARAFGVMLAGPVRVVARQLVALAAVLNAEADRLEPDTYPPILPPLHGPGDG